MPALKFAEGSDDVVEGLAIPFGGPFAGKSAAGVDVHGEAFGPETDLALDWFPNGRPLLYDHGLDGAVKTVLAGRQTDHEMTPAGVWARAQLDKSNRYFDAIRSLVRAGKLFFSSGSMEHLAAVNRRSGLITRWPWVELSMTPTPANLRGAIHATKSADLVEALDALDIAVPSGLVAEALRALDNDDDVPRAGTKFADDADRLLVDAESFRDRAVALVALRAKSGRILSAATREHLARHPGSLRELADDIDALLTEPSAEEPTKSASTDQMTDLRIETERLLSRSYGVTI